MTKSPTILSVLAAWGLPPPGSKQLRGHAMPHPHPQLQPGPGRPRGRERVRRGDGRGGGHLSDAWGM